MTSRTKSLPPSSPNVRTCSDISSIGVHPSVVAALLEYKQSLKVYDTIDNKDSDKVTTNNSQDRGEGEYSEGGALANEAAALIAHNSVTAIRNRLLLDITADYVCENAFRRLFVDHKTYPLTMEGAEKDPKASNSASSATTQGGDEEHLGTSPTRIVRPPCEPIVKGPKNKKEFITINTANPSLDLAIDDMLWIIDNRKAPATHARSLVAWQDHFKSPERSCGAAMPPVATTTTNASIKAPEPQASGKRPPTSGTTTTTVASATPSKGPITSVHTISPIYPLPPGAVGIAHSAQITLHRRNVVLTREYFATASAAEGNYRVAIQDLVPPPLPTLGLTSIADADSRANSSLGSKPENSSLSNNDNKDCEEKGSFDKLFKAFTKAVDEGVSRISKSGSDNAPGYRMNGQLISERVGLPPVAWRETLVLNIVTQWTYTLTIAVVKLVAINPSNNHQTLPTQAPTASSSQPQPTLNKELVVVRHISKRVYAQPTKAMFHTKEHRGESGDTMDYPNIYFNIDDFEDEDLFKDIKLCEGYTFAVLLTAGGTRNSNATIFRGALSYEIIMERIKRNTARNGGKGLPVTPSGTTASFSNSDAFGGKTGSSFVMGTEYLFGKQQGGASSSSTSTSIVDAYIPRMFIPLVGPERRGRAELAVSISEAELYLAQHSKRSAALPIGSANTSTAATDADPSSPAAYYGLGSSVPSGTSSFRDNYGGDASPPASPKPSTVAEPSSPSPNHRDTEKPKEEHSGIFGRFLNRVKSKVGSDNDAQKATQSQNKQSNNINGSASPSVGPAVDGPPMLAGNEAIQCCLTYVSVHAQHVMDVLLSAEKERSRQWLSYYDNQEELEKALNGTSVA